MTPAQSQPSEVAKLALSPQDLTSDLYLSAAGHKTPESRFYLVKNACAAIVETWQRFGLSTAEAQEQARQFARRFPNFNYELELEAVGAAMADDEALAPAPAGRD